MIWLSTGLIVGVVVADVLLHELSPLARWRRWRSR